MMWNELGISGGTAIVILIALYFVIKWAVKNGIKEAYSAITGKKTDEDIKNEKELKELGFRKSITSDLSKKKTEIVGSMFAKCEMQMVNFMGTELHETEFYQCDLRKADFRDATGYKVDILGSRLKDAKFSLPEAVNLLADLKIKLS